MQSRAKLSANLEADISLNYAFDIDIDNAHPSLLLPTEPFDPYWVPDLPDDEYHADRLAVSSSQLRLMLKSPAKFYEGYCYPDKKRTPAMILGSRYHEIVLLGGEAVLRGYVCIPPALLKAWGGPKSKKHKQAKAEWLAEYGQGKELISIKEFDQLRGMYDALASNNDAAVLLSDGESELSGYYLHEETGISCRVRPDFINTRVNALVDLKTTIDCSPKAFQRDLGKLRYDVQLAMYGDGFTVIEGMQPKFYAFITVEKTRPYEVAVYTVEAETMAIAYDDYNDCLRNLRQCIDTNTWPGAYPKIQAIGHPSWMLKQRRS